MINISGEALRETSVIISQMLDKYPRGKTNNNTGIKFYYQLSYLFLLSIFYYVRVLNNLFNICVSHSAFLMQALAILFSIVFGFAGHEVSIATTQVWLIEKQPLPKHKQMGVAVFH